MSSPPNTDEPTRSGNESREETSWNENSGEATNTRHSERRGGGRTGRGDRGPNRNRDRGHVFKGLTSEMNGHVFQTYAESERRVQFGKTVEMLGLYINNHLKSAEDMAPLYKELKTPTIRFDNTDDDEDIPDDLKEEYNKMKVKEHIKRKRTLRDNQRKIYAVIWGQCSTAMQASVKALDEYEERNLACDCIWLLKSVRAIMYRFDDTSFLVVSLANARHALDTFQQGQRQSNNAYYEEFKACVDAFEHHGGTLGRDHGLVASLTSEKHKDHPGPPPICPAATNDPDVMLAAYRVLEQFHLRKEQYNSRISHEARNLTIATMFLRKADRNRYGDLLTDLRNQHSRGLSQYPTTLSAAFTLLQTYTAPRTGHPRDRGNRDSDPVAELSFLQASELVPGHDGVTHTSIKCYRCQKYGHYRNQCPDVAAPQFLQLTSGGSAPLDFDAIFAHLPPGLNRNHIPSSWILLDSQSTMCVFKNPRYLRNIRRSGDTLTVLTNGGSQLSRLIGDLPNFGTVWFNPRSLANILSLAQVRQRCRVTMDTATEPSMIVHRADGTLMKFREYTTGLYIYDAALPKDNESVSDYCLVNTVAKNKALYHRREVEGAKRAKDLYIKLGRPSQQCFEQMLSNKLIHNCPVTTEDARRALTIYGPDVSALKGKTTKHKGTAHPQVKPITLPTHILENHKDVTLFVDILYVQGIPFVHTISKKLKLRTTAMIPRRNKTQLVNAVNKAVKVYTDRGFTVTDIHADLEFDCIRDDVAPIHLEIVPKDEHVHEVERSIRTIKEGTRTMVNGLPYK